MNTIDELESKLLQKHHATPVMGAELECYVTLAPEQVELFWQAVRTALADSGMVWERLEKERGSHQYEMIFAPVSPSRMAQILIAAKQIVAAEAARMNLSASFAAKPYEDEPSSGLHIHLHLENDAGEYLYHKTEDAMSDVLRFSLGGLLAGMAEDIAVFCPEPESWARFADIDHVPRNYSWGVNNRYCALRIPAERDPERKRIEHRMAGADAAPEAVITAILARVMEGLENRTEPPPQEYGKPASTIREANSQTA
jgi:glutamine synthetase